MGIDFTEHEPIEPPQQISGNIGCKCYKAAASLFVEWQEEPIYLYIIWIGSNKVSPVIGRNGFFDRYKEVVFCESEKRVILRKIGERHIQL